MINTDNKQKREILAKRADYKNVIEFLNGLGSDFIVNAFMIEDKNYLKLFDLVDDFSFIDKKNSIRFVNHSIRHSKEREQLYSEQGWAFNTVKIKI